MALQNHEFSTGLMIKVLYDGWSLVNRPNSPEALHLLVLLQQRHPQVQPILALPGEPPDWLPGGIDRRVFPEIDHPGAHLAWEQRRLPRLLRHGEADLLHLTSAHPPIFGPSLTLLSPAEPGMEKRSTGGEPHAGFMGRLRTAASAGGMSRLRAIFWPRDLSAHVPAGLSAPVHYLAAEPSIAIDPGSIDDLCRHPGVDLPETYILCHAPSSAGGIRRLLEAWSWAAVAIGEYYPLLILGLDPALKEYMDSLLRYYQLANSVRALPALSPLLSPALFQGAAAVFHPGLPTPWGGTLRQALRCARPLVAADSPLADALVGPAAYLAPVGDPRALGAGLITVIVEESVAERLSEAGKERAASWEVGDFREDLYAAYQAALQATA